MVASLFGAVAGAPSARTARAEKPAAALTILRLCGRRAEGGGPVGYGPMMPLVPSPAPLPPPDACAATSLLAFSMRSLCRCSLCVVGPEPSVLCGM